jgi:hypothetical protein
MLETAGSIFAEYKHLCTSMFIYTLFNDVCFIFSGCFPCHMYELEKVYKYIYYCLLSILQAFLS